MTTATLHEAPGSTREIAHGVWIRTAPAEAHSPADGHSDDLATAAGLPPWRAREFLAGRAVLRHLLREVRPELAALEVRPDPLGRPVLAGRLDVGISISHDGGTIAAALAPGRRVGVDVQLPTEDPSEGLLRRCMGEHAARVGELPPAERSTELAWVWTVQESCVKAAGTGLSGRPWSIRIAPGQRRGRWGQYTWLNLRDHSAIPLACAFSSAPDIRTQADLES